MNGLGEFILLLSIALWPGPDTTAPTHEELLHHQELYCAALTTFAEARNQSPRGQALVVATMVNRSKTPGYPLFICDIVAESDQYLGWQNWGYPRQPWKDDPVEWMRAQAIAELVLRGYFADPCAKDILFFHRARDSPGKCIEGDHVFF